jgi:hypothetical protein
MGDQDIEAAQRDDLQAHRVQQVYEKICWRELPSFLASGDA